jgi:alginate biosynthesis protein AlgX
MKGFMAMRGKGRLLFCAMLVLCTALSPGRALSGEFGSYASPEEYGWALYHKYHPAKRHMNAYPFPGPVIRAGEDIPVCEAARTPQAYLYKKDVKYIFHGKNGWLFRSADFRTDFTASPRALEYFRRLNQALKSKGQTLVVAFQPPRALMGQSHIDSASIPPGYDPAVAKRGYQSFLQQLHDAGIIAVDASNAPATLDYFPRGDFHWSPDGARFTAQQIAATIATLPGYKDLEKQEFISRNTGPAKVPARGAFETFIQNTCKVNIEMAAGPVWETEAKAKPGQASSLLGDDADSPGVTVIGTSNSAEDDKFNFVGSLKHFLQADVYNAAIVAGGFGSSPYRYLSSDEYKNSPPKFVVWEFLPQHKYNSDESALAFRQMIPAVYGACSKNEALATYSRDVTGENVDIFPEMKNKSLKNAYLYMEVTEPAERGLRVNILYGDGNADQVDMTRSTRAANNGKYYLDLATAADKPMVFFRLNTDKVQGHIDARLCQYPVRVASQ